AEQIPDQYHRVARGEALSLIAARYGTTVRELAALNDLRDPHRLRAGTVLRLPGAPGDAREVLTAAMHPAEHAATPAADAAAIEVASELAMLTAAAEAEPPADAMAM